MESDSPVRKLVRGIAGYAKALRGIAVSRPDLQKIYNNLCDVLDVLNEELKDEDEGMLVPNWKKFSTTGKTPTPSSV